MPPPLLPGPAPQDDDPRPDDAEDSSTGGRGRGGRQNQARRQVASAEDCLAALSSLPALILMGILKPSQANTIRGVYTAILQHYQKQQSPADRGGVADDALVEMLTRHPEYANLLEPFLPAELIATLFARTMEGSREHA